MTRTNIKCPKCDNNLIFCHQDTYHMIKLYCDNCNILYNKHFDKETLK